MKSTELLYQLGQSVWYDNIQRRLLKNGELAGMIERREIFGVTSNPSIFQNAIAKTNDYDSALKPMAWAGWKAAEIFWELAIEDIRAAADLFKPLFDETNGGDGYVSLEVNPLLAHDAEGTFQQAVDLWQKVDRENLMIKIPATQEGIVAFQKAITAGINVNVTLIFSLERYQDVIDAYMNGLEARIKEGKPVSQVASVASFFVSRVDSKVDLQLQKLVAANTPESKKAAALMGKAAISNVKLAYELFKKNFTQTRFEKLASAGAHLQRPLWASTSTKNASYRDVVYLEELIGSDTVNTVPPQTLVAFLDHGKVEMTVEKGVDIARQNIASLEALGIPMKQVTLDLENEGVKAFADAFDSLIQAIDEKAKGALDEIGPLAAPVARQVKKMIDNSSVKRLFDIDPTLWTTDEAQQSEILQRCNWLVAPWMKVDSLLEYEKLLKQCANDGFTHVLLLGMGGSSLAPEVLRTINGVSERDGKRGLDLAILDSTDPQQVKEAFERSAIEKTLYIVSSKSGGTAEVNAYFDYFWKKTEEKLGKKAGEHFVAITDAGTSLEKIAKEKIFRVIYCADSKVGGRNSALTAFGLVPAALIGMDLSALIKNAMDIADQCVPEVPFGANPGAMLGTVMGTAWAAGRDKLTVITDADWNSFGTWLEQLIAESSGKLGKGIIPVAQEPLTAITNYGKDRLFVYLRSTGENDTFCNSLRSSGQPVLEFAVNGAYDLGGQFYMWEVAIAIACAILQVNAFNQPDVQDNKSRTLKKIDGFHKDGKLTDFEPVLTIWETRVFSSKGYRPSKVNSVNELIFEYLEKTVKPGDYVAINAYLPRNATTAGALTALRKQILDRFGAATTLGFGPRFLHSTGQLHKGGPDNGVYLQVTADAEITLEIPGENITFGILERAQAIGDFEALEARNRRVLRVQLAKPDASQLLK